MTEIKLTTSGSVTIFRDDGKADTVEQLLTRLRDAGVARDDVQAVLLMAGAIKSQARLLRRIEVMEPLARTGATGRANLDIRNMKRGVPRLKEKEIRRLAETLAPRFKSRRSLHAAIARQVPDVTVPQVRQVLDPPKRKSR